MQDIKRIVILMVQIECTLIELRQFDIATWLRKNKFEKSCTNIWIFTRNIYIYSRFCYSSKRMNRRQFYFSTSDSVIHHTIWNGKYLVRIIDIAYRSVYYFNSDHDYLLKIRTVKFKDKLWIMFTHV